MILRCECGGVLKEATLAKFDFTPVAGIPSVLRNTPGLRCNRCHLPTLDGTVINETLRLMALAIAKQPERMTADHAKFSRKHMQLTQQALAERMGIARETIADWERGRDPISAQHDLMLRALVIVHLMRRAKNAPTRAEVTEAIGSVRPTRSHLDNGPFVIETAA